MSVIDSCFPSEPTISCFSHVSVRENSLTCSLDPGADVREDDDDDDDDEDNARDDIERMTVCFFNMINDTDECLEAVGATISSPRLRPLTAPFTLHVQSKRGRNIHKKIYLTKIVKPKSPQVWNVTFHPQSNQAVIQIQTPYQDDYLTKEKQLFQFHIWNSSRLMIQNVSASENLSISMEHLKQNAQYHIRVRAIPNFEYYEGSWSE